MEKIHKDMAKVSYSDADIQFEYYRPSQVRNIPLKQNSVRGYIPSLKATTKGRIWNYESQLERDFLYLLDHDLAFVPSLWENIATECKSQGFIAYQIHSKTAVFRRIHNRNQLIIKEKHLK